MLGLVIFYFTLNNVNVYGFSGKEMGILQMLSNRPGQ